MKKCIWIVIFLSICSLSYAAIEWKRFDAFKNVGGLNDAFSAIDIEIDEAADLQNVVLTTGGSIKTRDGFIPINGNSLNVTGTAITFYKPTSGSKFIVGIFDDGTIRKMDFSGGTDGQWDDITGSLVFTNDQDDLGDFAVGQDALMIEDGVGSTSPYIWSGSDVVVTLSGNPGLPNATMLAFHKNQAFAAGDSNNPSTLYFSDLDDITVWNGGLSGNIKIETQDGSVIRAIHPGFDSLYIWKDRSIWRLSGDDKDNYQLQRMVEDIGALSQQSVALVGNDFIFMDGQGDVYIYDGGIKVRLISTKIEGTTSQANFSRFDQVSAVEFEKDYYVNFSSSSNQENDVMMVFDTFWLAWLKFKGINANALTVGEDSNGKDAIYFMDYEGFGNQYPSGTGDATGTAISAFYLTKQYRFPEIPFNKNFRKMIVLAGQKGNYNLSVELRSNLQTSGTTETINLEGTTSSYGTAVYGTDSYGGQNLIVGETEWDSEGKFFQIKFSNENLDEPIDIKGWVPYVQGEDGI